MMLFTDSRTGPDICRACVKSFVGPIPSRLTVTFYKGTFREDSV